MSAQKGFRERFRRLVKVAPSKAALARAAKVSEGTVINWERGLGYHESTAQRLAGAVGVSIEWLRDGVGDEAAELSAAEKHLAQFPQREAGNSLPSERDTSSRIREDEEVMASPQTTAKGGLSALSRIIEKSADHQTPEELSETVHEVLRNTSIPKAERLELAARLNSILTRKINAERGSEHRHN